MPEVSLVHLIYHADTSMLTSMHSTGLSAATDLYLAIYPAIVLFHLQLPIRKKLALSAALGIGSMYMTQPSLSLLPCNSGTG